MTLKQNATSDVVINGKNLNTFTEPPVALANERAKASFPIRELTYYLDGGKKETEWLESTSEAIERSPYFDMGDFYDENGDKELLREKTMERVAALATLIGDGRSEKLMQKTMGLISVLDPGAYTRIGVHFGLFLSGVRGSGTGEQFSYWVGEGAATLHNFFGCFGMTEMGHGSNVAGVETTATYDRETEEFVINTPTVAATKWWIGGAAHTASHCLVFARLIVDGKDYGVKNFVVPLRDRSDWSLLPGIAIGDIGKKMGRDGIDNGWIQFSNVRIPRLFMMMKYAKVSADGKVTQPPLNQLSYGALIGGRVSMVHDSYTWSRRFLTIAIRYAAVRRQFSQDASGPETKLLDYTYHQRRLIPRLAYAYAMNAASSELYKIYDDATTKLANTDVTNKAALDEAISDIKELFSVSAGLKAFSTWGTSQIIDECRQACGGHGYSGYNGFGQGYNDWAVQCTWEGDNNVLCLSTGRALIQSTLAIRRGNKVGDAASYIAHVADFKPLGSRSLDDPAVLVEGWKLVAGTAINNTVDLFEQYIKAGDSQEVAFEKLSQQRFQTARLHTRGYLVKAFFDAVAKANKQIQPILLKVAKLFALWSIEEEGTSFLRYGFLQAADLEKVTLLVNKYCQEVREQAIPLTDAFNQSDFFINAPIGNYDGNVYKDYFRKVNVANPKSKTTPPYFEKVVLPFFHRAKPEVPDLSSLEEEDE